ERDAEADQQYRDAIAERAKLIAAQIRADIAAPIDLSGLTGAERIRAMSRIDRAEIVCEDFICLLAEVGRDITLARKLLGKHSTAAYLFQTELLQKCIDAYSLRVAEREIDGRPA